MICVIDYGLGNTGSILNMFKYLGIKAVSSSDLEEIKSSTHLVLPGVGTFDSGVGKLDERNLKHLLHEEVIINKKPVLGICLGAQLMLDSSREGMHPGLGWIKGENVRFDTSVVIKSPHMGWNYLQKINDTALFAGMPYDPPRFYFVHNYYFDLHNAEDIAATTLYGTEFPSAFRRGNICGVQFHPEKSHRFGMQLLLNFSGI